MDSREGAQTASPLKAALDRLTDPDPYSNERMYVLSYMGLRKAVGFIAAALPIVLLIGKPTVAGGGMEGSISAYYYTGCGATSSGPCVLWLFFSSPIGTHLATTF
jgi:hypothetical protein